MKKTMVTLSAALLVCLLATVTSLPQTPTTGLPLDGQGVGGFPELSAGISAYIQIDRPVDLVKARQVFDGVEVESDDYVIGIVRLESMPEEVWPHVYVDRNGWFLAYYSKHDPAVKLMPWHDADGTAYKEGPLRTTTLEMALDRLTTRLLTTPEHAFSFSTVAGQLRYYDFRFPQATQFVFGVKTAAPQSETLFRYSIPVGVVLYEASWAHRAINLVDSYISARWSESKLNGVRLFRGGDGSYYASGLLPDSGIHRDTAHAVSIGQGESRGISGIAVAFVYGH